MARRQGSAVRCTSGRRSLPASAQRTQPNTRRGLGEEEGWRGGGACALLCAPPCRALRLSTPRAHTNQYTTPAVTFALY
eukprot:3695503-Rhodomonas_salina.1